MNEVLQALLSLPAWLISAIIGALVGASLGAVITRVFKIRWALPAAGAIAAIVAIPIGDRVLPSLQASLAVDSVMGELSQQRMYHTLFRIHPEAEAELRSRMTAIIANSPEDEVFLRAQAASAELVGRYFVKDVPSLPDAMVHKLLLRQVEAMRQLQSKPATCVAYYLGKPQLARDKLSTEFIEIESNLKADAFESAAANPAMSMTRADEADLGEELALAYVARGYPIADLEKVGSVEAVPAEEGCRLALQFMDAIAALGPAQSSYMFKNLVQIGQQAN